MTPDEVLAVIRRKIAWWREEAKADRYTLMGTWRENAHTLSTLLDDLDPDRIDAGRLRAELTDAICQARTGLTLGKGWAYEIADALLAKGWRK